MFDLGFIADIRYILRRLPRPEHRQSMLFSATLSQRVLELAYEHMNNPELVRIEPDKVTIDRIRQVIYFPSMEEKIPLLIGLLRETEAHRTMVFVNTRRMAERLEAALRANGFNAQALSGDVPQKKRLQFLRQFHEGELAVLIATDVASRGLHIPDVSHVFNFDLPQDAGRLRAPHRPHCPRRRRRRRHQLRLRGICCRRCPTSKPTSAARSRWRRSLRHAARADWPPLHRAKLHAPTRRGGTRRRGAAAVAAAPCRRVERRPRRATRGGRSGRSPRSQQIGDRIHERETPAASRGARPLSGR